MSEPDKVPEKADAITPRTDDVKIPAAITEAANSNQPTANDNAAAPEEQPAPAAAADAPSPEAGDPPAPPSRKGVWKKRALSFAFNAAAGAAVSALAKTVTIAGMTFAGAPALMTMLAAGVAVGVGSTLLHDARSRRAQRKQGLEVAAYFSKAHAKDFFTSKTNLKVFGFSTVAAIAGSALFLGFQSGAIQEFFGFGKEAAPVPPVALPPAETVTVAPPAEPVAPVEPAVAPVAPCLTPLEQFNDLIKDQQVSAEVQDALRRAGSTSARVSAQGIKDLAYFASNGFGGVPENGTVAVELFRQAADAGNLQAKVDLLYMQYHGLNGIPANKEAALGAMQDIKGSARAAMFTREWGGGKVLPAVEFSTKSILQGMKAGCPA